MEGWMIGWVFSLVGNVFTVLFNIDVFNRLTNSSLIFPLFFTSPLNSISWLAARMFCAPPQKNKIK